MPRHRRTGRERPALLEGGVLARAAGEVPRIQLADGVDRSVNLFLRDLGGGCPLANRALGLERVLDADAIEVLPVPQRVLPLAVRGAQLRVFAKQLFAPRVQAQILGLARREVRAQIVVLALELLPAGGDERNLLRDELLRDGRGQRGIESLRPEKDDCGGRRHLSAPAPWPGGRRSRAFRAARRSPGASCGATRWPYSPLRPAAWACRAQADIDR